MKILSVFIFIYEINNSTKYRIPPGFSLYRRVYKIMSEDWETFVEVVSDF